VQAGSLPCVRIAVITSWMAIGAVLGAQEGSGLAGGAWSLDSGMGRSRVSATCLIRRQMANAYSHASEGRQRPAVGAILHPTSRLPAVCHNGYGASALSTIHSRLHTGLLLGCVPYTDDVAQAGCC
jgi:hypothetical protein